MTNELSVFKKSTSVRKDDTNLTIRTTKEIKSKFNEYSDLEGMTRKQFLAFLIKNYESL